MRLAMPCAGMMRIPGTAAATGASIAHSEVFSTLEAPVEPTCSQWFAMLDWKMLETHSKFAHTSSCYSLLK